MRFIGKLPGASPRSYCAVASGCVLPFNVTIFFSSTADEIRDATLAVCPTVATAAPKRSANTTVTPVMNFVFIEISRGVTRPKNCTGAHSRCERQGDTGGDGQLIGIGERWQATPPACQTFL